MDDFLGIIIVVIGISLSIFLYTDSNYWKNEVTVYSLFHYEGDKNTIKTETSLPVTYKALFEQQRVIYWQEGSAPQSYEKCVVRDYKNWKCDVKSSIADNYEIKMLDGKLTDSPLKLKESEIVPKWKWWLVRIQEINLI